MHTGSTAEERCKFHRHPNKVLTAYGCFRWPCRCSNTQCASETLLPIIIVAFSFFNSGNSIPSRCYQCAIWCLISYGVVAHIQLPDRHLYFCIFVQSDLTKAKITKFVLSSKLFPWFNKLIPEWIILLQCVSTPFAVIACHYTGCREYCSLNLSYLWL